MDEATVRLGPLPLASGGVVVLTISAAGEVLEVACTGCERDEVPERLIEAMAGYVKGGTDEEAS